MGTPLPNCWWRHCDSTVVFTVLQELRQRKLLVSIVETGRYVLCESITPISGAGISLAHHSDVHSVPRSRTQNPPSPGCFLATISPLRQHSSLHLLKSKRERRGIVRSQQLSDVFEVLAPNIHHRICGLCFCPYRHHGSLHLGQTPTDLIRPRLPSGTTGRSLDHDWMSSLHLPNRRPCHLCCCTCCCLGSHVGFEAFWKGRDIDGGNRYSDDCNYCPDWTCRYGVWCVVAARTYDG